MAGKEEGDEEGLKLISSKHRAETHTCREPSGYAEHQAKARTTHIAKTSLDGQQTGVSQVFC